MFGWNAAPQTISVLTESLVPVSHIAMPVSAVMSSQEYVHMPQGIHPEDIFSFKAYP